ncbi:GNAT family N-acetyltransferase [Demequina sp. NBRC 110056]|uniref:GNAT family N-acetyltransferase n=1 Tax=Demequina sp. NBRC 110056 TaxID=1570345 RepID=UPI000A0729B6|nr:GNAT family N-acetyltransferase [Demequina sp. NBRC 110056]
MAEARPAPDVRLRRWTDADLPILVASNSPEMTRMLGGPESSAQVRRRHERYLRGWDVGNPRMFSAVSTDGRPLGSVGWWESTFDDRDVYELGWVVLPAQQGRGVASAMARLAVDDALGHGDGRDLMACPPVENAASNGVCRAAGFTLAATRPEEFRGVQLTLNFWVRSGAASGS